MKIRFSSCTEEHAETSIMGDDVKFEIMPFHESAHYMVDKFIKNATIPIHIYHGSKYALIDAFRMESCADGSIKICAYVFLCGDESILKQNKISI